MAELVLLSIIQGVTEFLPVSYSAHLILVAKYFNLSNANLTLDISLHLGSFLAIVFYFRNELINFINLGLNTNIQLNNRFNELKSIAKALDAAIMEEYGSQFVD